MSTTTLPMITLEARIAALYLHRDRLAALATQYLRRGDVPAYERYSDMAWSVNRRINILKKEAAA